MSVRIVVFIISTLLSMSAPVQAGERLYLDFEQTLLGANAFTTKGTFMLKTFASEYEDGVGAAFPAMARWQLQFFDSSNIKVDFIQGQGTPSVSGLDWHGITREGQMLLDGFYTVRFVWIDAVGAPHRTSDVKVSVLSPPGLREILDSGVSLTFRDNEAVLRLPEKLTFPRGLATLMPSSLPILQDVANLLLRYPGNRVIIQGYSDITGTSKINDEISSKRAQAVYNFFVGNGLRIEQMTYAGLGAQNPIASNATEEDRAKNRRVEIVMKKAGI